MGGGAVGMTTATICKWMNHALCSTTHIEYYDGGGNGDANV